MSFPVGKKTVCKNKFLTGTSADNHLSLTLSDGFSNSLLSNVLTIVSGLIVRIQAKSPLRHVLLP